MKTTIQCLGNKEVVATVVYKQDEEIKKLVLEGLQNGDLTFDVKGVLTGLTESERLFTINKIEVIKTKE